MFIIKHKRYFVNVFLILLTILLLLIIFKDKIFNRNILKSQDNYTITYAGISDSNIKEIAKYDVAILEPSSISKEQVHTLKKSNTISYGYQSIVEVANYDTEKIDQLKEEDYLHVDGVKLLNEYYQCYYGDIRSDNYKQVLIDSISKNVIDKGFDGVFFDTLDDVEFFTEEPLRTELFNEYIEFFKTLNSTFPKLSIIQNRAFNLFTLGSAKYIDGFMYEDFQHQYFKCPDNAEFYNNLKNNLSQTAEDNNNVILALSYQEEKENQKLANELGWLYFFYSNE